MSNRKTQRALRILKRAAVGAERVEAVGRLRKVGWLEDGTLRAARLGRLDLSGSDLHKADLRFANLRNASLQDANLDGAALSEAQLFRANLRDVSAVGANFHAAHLAQAELDGANLTWADFSEAFLAGVTFVGARVDGVSFIGADLRRSGLSVAQARSASALRMAWMPGGWRYDGRFCLAADLADARLNSIAPDDPVQMAGWYAVSLEAFRAGQRAEGDRDR